MKKGIFEELKEANDNIEVDEELKDRFLMDIDIDKNDEGYYIDAFENPISFNGIRQLKKPYTKLKLNKYHQQEILAVQNDYYYFRKNYCKILTKSGIGRPEPRNYQERAEKTLMSGDDTILFFPRQCINKDTIINIDNKDITIGNFFNLCREKTKNIIINNDKFIETIEVEDKFIDTHKGKVKIINVHKTVPFRKYRIELDNGLFLEGAYNHVVIDKNYKEVFIKDSINIDLITKNGISKVINVIDLEIEENMYDVSVDSVDELFFSNNILSHNSGKTVTIAGFLLWSAITTPNINIGISANVVSLATEVLDKIKKIYIEMPIWLQPGLVSWNKKSIEFDNGTKILTAASNGNAFRGYSLTKLYCDEAGFIRNSEFHEFMDATMPAMAAIPDSQAIFSSTANGLNFFYHMVEGAKKNATKIVDNDYKIDNITIEEFYNKKEKNNKIKEVIKKNNNKYEIVYEQGINGYRLCGANWQEVPRWNKDGTILEPEVFKQEQIDKNGLLHFEQNFGNCVGYDTYIETDIGKIKIGELYDSL